MSIPSRCSFWLDTTAPGVAISIGARGAVSLVRVFPWSCFPDFDMGIFGRWRYAGVYRFKQMGLGALRVLFGPPWIPCPYGGSLVREIHIKVP